MKKTGILILLVAISLTNGYAQKIRAKVNAGAHLVKTMNWSTINNSIITVEHIDGTNKHTYSEVPRNYNSDAMYVKGIDDDFIQGVEVFVYVVHPSLNVLSSIYTTATVDVGEHLIAAVDWDKYQYSSILVEELDGRNWHVYETVEARLINPKAMFVSGIDKDFEQGTPVRVYNLETSILVHDGMVGIGTHSPDHKLDVVGTIRAHQVLVNTQKGADFVFEDSYNLRSLEEVKQFISTNKHLPDIAPASLMVTNGVDMGELQMQLLQKVEELTLYVLELKEENSHLKKGLMLQQQEIDQIKTTK